MNGQKQLSIAAITLCALSATLYELFSHTADSYTVRELSAGALCAALCLAFVFGVVLWAKAVLRRVITPPPTGQGARVLQQSPPIRVCAGAFALMFCAAALACVWQQEELYCRQFGAGYLWILLLAGGVCALRCTHSALGRCASVLLVLCAAAAIALVIGLAGQMDWKNLSLAALSTAGIEEGFRLGFRLYPEYLLLLFLDEKGKHRAIIALPFFVVLLQILSLLLGELVFGVQGASLQGGEVLRAWEFLAFSRFDAVIVLLWLLTAMFRLRFLVFAAQSFWAVARGKIKGESEAVCDAKQGVIQN